MQNFKIITWGCVYMHTYTHTYLSISIYIKHMLISSSTCLILDYNRSLLICSGCCPSLHPCKQSCFSSCSPPFRPISSDWLPFANGSNRRWVGLMCSKSYAPDDHIRHILSFSTVLSIDEPPEQPAHYS